MYSTPILTVLMSMANRTEAEYDRTTHSLQYTSFCSKRTVFEQL